LTHVNEAVAFAAEQISAGVPGVRLGEVLPAWSILPFAGMLLTIALFPLLAPHFWHRHYPKISLAWALILAVPFLIAYRGAAMDEILRVTIDDYVPFVTLLWGLFTVSGGIVLRGAPSATPAVNTLMLLAGTVAASWIGTTGAAMLLIRPLIRANAGRRHVAHVVVFFIFLVGNVGGCLTPLGDPPLFLGLLHGVPFFWTLHLFPQMAFVAAALLAIFFLIDRHLYRKEAGGSRDASAPPEGGGIRVAGAHNLIFLAGIVVAVLAPGLMRLGEVSLFGFHVSGGDLLREGGILLMAVLSLATTSHALREENRFSWEPIREVAILFAAIFMTMIPALAILKAGERGQLAFLIRAVREPWQYFWAVGGLSSFLDNAPTYLTFFTLELGRLYPGIPEAVAVPRLIAEHPLMLQAVSAGAVFMGANTYIGNAPNFMIRSIAEEAGIAMPSFLGYVFRWSLPILIPLFVLTGLIFY
jgi:Na+/H+ antiporter NhaD/arsenite permease-like protein